MLEAWLEELGAVIQLSIYDDGMCGYAKYGPERPDEFNSGLCTALRLRYTWTEIHIGWGPTFDRWANSLDWWADVPTSTQELSSLLDMAIRLGDSGDRCEKHEHPPKLN